jgi:NADH dehydrogenase [ubiquinone] 1 alpha subcomplex assembly factor 7
MAENKPQLETEIRRRIAMAGPMPVAQYMSHCLTHPQYGYYMTRDPFGTAGDFTTSPEISQMFGELIGLWCAAVWRQLDAPDLLRLVELGPGRGTMMLDALRAAKAVPGFRKAIAVHFVEVSPVLEQRQRQSFERGEVPTAWHASLDDVPPGPSIILANEFFDAQPVQQAVMCVDGWHERVVKLDDNDNLVFTNGRDPIPLFDQMLPASVRNAQIGEIFEWRADQIALEIGRRVMRSPGAALILDYGHVKSTIGDTLQAVGGHQYAKPLTTPGQLDLTAHVDFQALAQAAESMDATTHGPIEQGEFLRRLGIETRAKALRSAVPANRVAEIDLALSRLTNRDRTGMGRLFKAIGFAPDRLGPLPGFEF